MKRKQDSESQINKGQEEDWRTRSRTSHFPGVLTLETSETEARSLEALAIITAVMRSAWLHGNRPSE